MNEHDRLKGMLWGLVVGDCLGSPIQFMGKDDHPYITDMVPCAHFNTPPGYWTDDASMAFCIMESFIQCGEYNLADIGKKFVEWYQHGFWSSLPYAFDVGGATSSAMHKIAQGTLVNGEEDSQGNGSIMRFAPSYIMNLGNDDDVMLFEISNLTHKSGAVRKVVNRMRRVCDYHIKGKRTKITSPYKKREDVNNSGWAVSTLDAALWAFHTTKSFEEGMIAAVNLGGDSDTIGAVYGQIAGLFYGYEAIPERWLSAIKDRDKVEDLIERFLEQKDKIASANLQPDCGQKCPLAELAKINYFARKWHWKFLDRYPDIGDHGNFADECWNMGFGMDSGEWISKTYPETDVKDPAGLRSIISDINNVFFLGTAIFSFWRSETHWSYMGFGIFSDESREWMLIALARLIELTTEYRIILSDNDGSTNCVIEASPNRIIIDRGTKKYGPIAKEYFVYFGDKFGCHLYSKHIPTKKDSGIIKKVLAKESLPVLPAHTIWIEEEFWGREQRDNNPDNHACFVERNDGSVIHHDELKNKIPVAGVFAIPDRKYVLPSLKAGDRIVLVRERDNEHDENAIRVETLSGNKKLGYIPRQIAAVLAVELDRGYDHIGSIEEVDPKTQKIIISVSRREHMPIDDVTSIELRESSGIPGLSESNIVTTVYFKKKRFVRKETFRLETKVTELDFTDKAWEQFAYPALRRCNFLKWAEDSYDEVWCDDWSWKFMARRGKGTVIKTSGGRPLPIEWDQMQNFIKECLNLEDIKGNGKFYIETPKSFHSIPFEKLDFDKLFLHQGAYERIDAVGKTLHPEWDIIEFEKSLFGAGGKHFFERGKDDVLKARLFELDSVMPFLKFEAPGQHYGYELFLSPSPGLGTRATPFLWAYIARQFTYDKLPMSTEDIIRKFRDILHSLGIDETCEEHIYIKRFDSGGMSRGLISGKNAWERFLPVILRRNKLYK